MEGNVAEMNKPDCETDMSNIGNQKVRLQNGKQDNVCNLEYQSNAQVVHTQKRLETLPFEIFSIFESFERTRNPHLPQIHNHLPKPK